jgi:hypothetical protein
MDYRHIEVAQHDFMADKPPRKESVNDGRPFHCHSGCHGHWNGPRDQDDPAPVEGNEGMMSRAEPL